VRFSSDTVPTSPDLKTTCGIAIKLFGVPGPKLLAPDEDATTHDFLLQNHDVFFVDTARDMCEFTEAGVVHGDGRPVPVDPAWSPGGREHFLDPDYLERLASDLPEHQELRDVIYTTFRDWDRDGESPVPWPWI
jgi:hypothetical protein